MLSFCNIIFVKNFEKTVRESKKLSLSQSNENCYQSFEKKKKPFRH